MAACGMSRGSVDDVGAGILDLPENGAEIDLTGPEPFPGHDPAAEFFEGVPEILIQALGVVGTHVKQHCGLLGLEVRSGELGRDRALEGVDETGAEGGADHRFPVEVVGNLGIGRGSSDDGDARRFGHGSDGNGRSAGTGPDDGDDPVPDQALGDIDTFQLISLEVIGDQLDLPAEDAALGIDSGHFVLDGVVFRDAPRSGGARERNDLAHLDGLARLDR